MASKLFTTADLAHLLREAEAAHGDYERQLGHADDTWPDWYAAYMHPRIPGFRDYADEPEELPSTEPYLSE